MLISIVWMIGIDLCYIGMLANPTVYSCGCKGSKTSKHRTETAHLQHDTLVVTTKSGCQIFYVISYGVITLNSGIIVLLIFGRQHL